ncbi:hypothetical protein ALC60_00134, partial [Trachymyrmex zeteki]
NCQELDSKVPEFQTDVNFDIWYLQETKLVKDTQIHSKSHSFERTDINAPSQSGAAIAVKGTIHYESLDLSFIQHASVELMGIKIYIEDFPCLIINVCKVSQNKYLSLK